MDEWDDPLELRIRLDLALERIAVLEGELADLRARHGSVLAQSVPSAHEASATSTTLQRPRSAGPGRLVVDQSSSPEAKLALFRELFAGRHDVYALRWTSAKSGKSGWSPVERDPFGAWERPQDEREFLPLTDEVLTQHLARTAPGARQVQITDSSACRRESTPCVLLRCAAKDSHREQMLRRGGRNLQLAMLEDRRARVAPRPGTRSPTH